jgi:hypothetical protein
MDAFQEFIATSLFVLTGLLVVLCARGVREFRSNRKFTQLWWAGGLALAAAAMAVEAVVYIGVVTESLLQAYVFFSAAIVGILSLGATKVLHRPRLERGYTYYTLVTCLAVAGASFLTPLSRAAMVSQGIIVGNPPLVLLVLSSLVTVPATVVLLSASVVALRRTWKWQTLLMIGGALILGAGGALYIASFPVALYYAEFIGILLLFFGLIGLPKPTAAAAASGHPTASA